MEIIIIKKTNPIFIEMVKRRKIESAARHEKIFADFKQKHLDSGSLLSYGEWIKEYINNNAVNQ